VQAAFDPKPAVSIAALRALAERGHQTVVDEITPAIDADKLEVRDTLPL
jgi:hypothetical protein